MNVSQFTPEELSKIRYKCRTDLFFFGKEILGKRFIERTHRSVCDFFVKKDPSFATFRDFALQYNGPHDRLLLLPRKSYKSTIKVIDNLQWQICWPDIRIIVLTAVNRLAAAFMDEFQSYFVVKGGTRVSPTEVKGGEPTFFQQLFSQWAIEEKEVSKEFISPARKAYFKEPTIGAMSMEQAGAGWACDIIDFDDPVGEKNTRTGMRLEGLDEGIAMYSKLKMNYGFRHLVGTRYDPNDPYGRLCESNDIMEIYGNHQSAELLHMSRPCWWLKGKPFEQPNYKEWIPNEADLDLFFPEDLPFRYLAKELKEHSETFFSQELNNPIESSNVQFTEDLIRACMVDRSALPKNGKLYGAWDLANSTSRTADFSVCPVGLLDDHGEWWIIDIIRGHFDWTEKPYQIVNTIRVHNLTRAAIEDCQGARGLTEIIERHAREMKVELNLDWISLGKGTDDAKFERMMLLHPWFTSRRIHLLNTISCMDELMREFSNIGNKRARNDIPDSMSRLLMQYSGLATALAMPTTEDRIREWHEIADREMYNMIFGVGKYAEGGQERERREEPEGFYDSMTGLRSPYPI